jgi:putative ABC transport system permease protein
VRLRSVLHLYRIRLRSRLVQELLALVGIAVGVALVFAALVANTSLTGSVRQLTSAIVGDATLQLASRSAAGMDARRVAEIEAIDGVGAAAPVLEARANLVGPHGRRSVLLIGGDARFARLGGDLLPRFSDDELGRQRTLGVPTPIVDELGLALGQHMRVEIAPRTRSVPLGARLQSADVGTLVHSPVTLASLPFAQALTRRQGRVSRVFVRPEPGRAAEVEAALREIAGDRLNVAAASAEVDVFERAAYPTNQSTSLFSVFSALVGFLFAFSAVLLTVPQRRRLLADLRMAGHEPWVLVQLLLFDALVLGCAGGVLGIGLGDQISRHLFADTPSYLSSAFAVGSQRIVTWDSVVIAAGAGVVAACVAVLVPLREILARHPLSGKPAGRRRGSRSMTAGGIACLLGTLGLAILAPEAALAAIVALTLALLLLLPLLLRAVAAAAEVPGRLLHSPVPILALLELRSRGAQMRTLAVAATGATAVFATVSIGGAHADLERGLQASARDIDGNADIWVTFAGRGNTLATTPFQVSDRVLRDLAREPPVAGVQTYRGGFLDIDDRRVWVLAPPAAVDEPVPPSQITEGEESTVTARLRAGGWVALSAALAQRYEVEVGDAVALPSPAPTTFRVAAITTNLAWPPGAIVLNADDYARAWGTAAQSGLLVELEQGVPAAQGAAIVERALPPGLPLTVETAHERTLRHYATARDALARLSQISALVLLSAALAMAAAMGGMIWQRRRTLAALKVHGYPESELWRALLLESSLLLGSGCLVGAAFGLAGQALMTRALESITGFPILYATAALTALGMLALVTVVAVAMLAVPGWLAVRVRPSPGAAA